MQCNVQGPFARSQCNVLGTGTALSTGLRDADKGFTPKAVTVLETNTIKQYRTFGSLKSIKSEDKVCFGCGYWSPSVLARCSPLASRGWCRHPPIQVGKLQFGCRHSRDSVEQIHIRCIIIFPTFLAKQVPQGRCCNRSTSSSACSSSPLHS